MIIKKLQFVYNDCLRRFSNSFVPIGKPTDQEASHFLKNQPLCTCSIGHSIIGGGGSTNNLGTDGTVPKNSREAVAKRSRNATAKTALEVKLFTNSKCP